MKSETSFPVPRAVPVCVLLAVLLCFSACGDGGDSPEDDSANGITGHHRIPLHTGSSGTSSSSDTTDASARGAVIIDHKSTDREAVPVEWIDKARGTLHIAYGHTSHGSQITSGMEGLVGFKGKSYAFSPGGSGGALDLRDNPFTGARDLGDPDRTAWADATRAYLDQHPEVNVVVWAWCGQVDGTPDEIGSYLSEMSSLETQYPGVDFVYMTGHLDGTGLKGNVHLRNEQIRSYCRQNGKILYDFADIESYDPDGRWYGDKIPDDGCNYDSDKDGVRDANWAALWQASHTEGVDWYSCGAEHTEPLNANLKAYAAWWMWARLAGWEG